MKHRKQTNCWNRTTATIKAAHRLKLIKILIKIQAEIEKKDKIAALMLVLGFKRKIAHHLGSSKPRLIMIAKWNAEMANISC